MSTPAPTTRLGQILREEGRRQSWLADQVGVHESLVSRWVHGLQVPEAMQGPIAEALGREVADVFPSTGVAA